MAKLSSLCVYCGSSNDGPESHRTVAITLGRMMAERNIRLIYGGGGVGVMGAVADAVMEAGGEATGIIPDFLMHQEVGNRKITSLEIVGNMHDRKSRMAELSDGFLILPGGMGTLEEFFEILTWRKLSLHDKPIAILNIDGYWDRLRDLTEEMVAASYAKPSDAALAPYFDTPEAALDALAQHTGTSSRLDSDKI
jgi:uncharacterized protein (TIGR00730 family)